MGANAQLSKAAPASQFSPEQRRQLAIERGLDPDFPWADWILLEEVGELQRREHEIRRNILREKARLERLRREGYSFDAEHRLVAPPAPSLSRFAPSERRPRRSSTVQRALARSPDEPPLDESDPPDIAAIPPEHFWRDVDAWRGAA